MTGVKKGCWFIYFLVCLFCMSRKYGGRDFWERKQSLWKNLAKHSLAMFQHENKGWLSDDSELRITFSYSKKGQRILIPTQCVLKQVGLFIRYMFFVKTNMRTQRMPLCPSCTSPPQRSTLSFYPPLTPVLLFALTPSQSNGTCGDIMTRSFSTLSA